MLGVLNDLHARGIEDILIASIVGLKGFPDAIAQVFPKTEIQLCVVHQIRNSLKYVVSKDQNAFMVDLKRVYQATSKDLAEHDLLELSEKWGKNIQLSLNPGSQTGIIYLLILSILSIYAALFTRLTLLKTYIVKCENTQKAKVHLSVKIHS